MSSEVRRQFRGGEFLIAESSPESAFAPEDLTEEHHMIAQTTGRFVAEEVLPRMEEIEQSDPELTRELLKKASDLGLLAIEVPEQYGGLGLDMPSSAVVAENLAQAASFSVSYGAHSGIGTLPIVYFGTEEQKQKYLPKLASAEFLSAYALTESEAGSDALAARSTAVLSSDEKHWILNGEKMWISNAGFADLFIVFAKIEGKEFSAFIVERSYSGVSVGEEEKKMGIKGSSTCILGMENVPVPVENLLGERGKGHRIALNILNIGRLKLGAGCVGAAKSALDEAVRYALERRQFGHPIGEFGAIQEKLAGMALRTWVGESMAYRTVGMIDAALGRVDREDPRQLLEVVQTFAVECSILKVWATEMLDFVVDEALQIHGGNGYSQEYPVERYYRDSRINRIFEGTNEINRLLITGMLLRRAFKGELPLMEAAQGVLSELLSFPAPLDEDDRLGQERRMVEDAKKAALMVAGLAGQKHGEHLADEQELVMAISDMIMEVYAMESAVMRALKMGDGNAGRSAVCHQMVQCYLHGAIERIQSSGKKVLGEISRGDEQRTYRAALRRFCKHPLIPSIQLRREIAGVLLKAGTYPL